MAWTEARWAEFLKVTRSTEWVVEPVDQYEDIIDPIHTDKRGVAQVVETVFSNFPEAVYADVAACHRRGSEAEGETDRRYDYQRRFYRDGRVVALRTVGDGLTPVEV